MHIIKKIKVVDKTKGQIMPSNITQPLKSRHGDCDGSSAPTSKSNLNWLFYNRGIKNKFCLRLLLWDWLRMYSLSTLRSCCIIFFFKISLFKGILVNQFWLVSGNVPPEVIRLKLFSFMQLCEKHENDCLKSTQRVFSPSKIEWLRLYHLYQVQQIWPRLSNVLLCPRESKTVDKYREYNSSNILWIMN